MPYPPVEEIRRRLEVRIAAKAQRMREEYDAAEARRREEKREAQSLRQIQAHGRRKAGAGSLTRLGRIRVGLGYTQREMAQHLGVDIVAYRNVERGLPHSLKTSRASREKIVRGLAELGAAARTITTSRELRDDDGNAR